jgi:hypothetical protein
MGVEVFASFARDVLSFRFALSMDAGFGQKTEQRGNNSRADRQPDSSPESSANRHRNMVPARAGQAAVQWGLTFESVASFEPAASCAAQRT